ncbi:MAG: hypothetical protein AAGI71_16985 [Bacteroidota bacterium]
MKLVYTSHQGFQIRIFTPPSEPDTFRCVAKRGLMNLYLHGSDADALEADARTRIDALLSPHTN